MNFEFLLKRCEEDAWWAAGKLLGLLEERHKHQKLIIELQGPEPKNAEDE
jgi:hypothetical protein